MPLFSVKGAASGDRAQVWMHNLFLRLQGPEEAGEDASDESAAIELTASQAWLTSVSVVGMTPATRGLSLNASDLYAAGVCPCDSRA